ncbi:MAG: GNAT family N-acetyltransferase [Candidatus Cloacimonetes bacterium]|nr:GNAT family N-acetyltransferase [Candidatus Cloacimonadota bacterium]
MKYYQKLKGERLFLAPIRVEDADVFCQWFSDPEVALNITMFDRQFPLQKEEDLLQNMIKNNSQIFSIVLFEEEKLIGTCSFFDIDKDDRKAELGIMIGDKTCWNKGYGTEALELLLDYGFNILNLNNIYLKAFDYNKRALVCYEKLGFKLIGRHRQARIIMGKKYDEIFYDLLADEFTHSRLQKLFSEL